MTAVLVVSHLLLAAGAFLLGRRGRRATYLQGVAAGSALRQMRQRWESVRVDPPARKRMWRRLDRKPEPEPSGLVTKRFTEADRLFRH